MTKDAVNDSLLLSFIAEHWVPLTAVLTTAWLAKNYFCNGLNKYPGPKLAAVTDWWRFWVVWGRRPEVVHLKLHEKHGDIVRLGPNSLSFANPEALKTIYGLNKGMTKVSALVLDLYLLKEKRNNMLTQNIVRLLRRPAGRHEGPLSRLALQHHRRDLPRAVPAVRQRRLFHVGPRPVRALCRQHHPPVPHPDGAPVRG